MNDRLAFVWDEYFDYEREVGPPVEFRKMNAT